MDLVSRRRKGRWIRRRTLLSFFSLCALLTSFTIISPVSLASRAAPPGLGRVRQRNTAALGFMVGPGSYPPRCLSKCGICSPCKPVHVPVPPGRPVIAEYYPEAWRCKCGGKLYIP